MVISISFLWDMVSSSFRQNSLCETPRADRCSRCQERLQKELDEEKRSSWILASKIPVAGYWWYDIPTYTRILCYVSPAFFKKREEIQNGSILPQKHSRNKWIVLLVHTCQWREWCGNAMKLGSMKMWNDGQREWRTLREKASSIL